MGDTATRPLFRAEVLANHRERLHGDVLVALPTSWQLIGFLLAVALLTALTFLALAPYSRVEVVPGTIVVDKGTSVISPSRAGIVSRVAVREGQQVRRGTVLAHIRSEEDLASGQTAPQQMLDALAAQERDLRTQSRLLVGAAEAERSRLFATALGLQQEISNLDAQIDDQRQLLRLSEGEVAQVRQVAANGFLSRRDLESRESTLIARRQQLSQLQQARSAKLATLSETRRASIQSEATGQAQAMAVQAQGSALAQQRAQVTTARGYVVTAPVDGTVTALTARSGQVATPGQSLMTIVPAGGRARVELTVPTRSAGFIAEGQAVRLAIDSFPYQQFGTVPGTISEVARAAVMVRSGESGPAVPVYLVTAELPQPFVKAFGRQQHLLPGMTLSARIITRRQSLLEWLFEPLVAVGRR